MGITRLLIYSSRPEHRQDKLARCVYTLVVGVLSSAAMMAIVVVVRLRLVLMGQDGSSPIHFAITQNHPRIADALKKWQGKYQSK